MAYNYIWDSVQQNRACGVIILSPAIKIARCTKHYIFATVLPFHFKFRKLASLNSRMVEILIRQNINFQFIEQLKNWLAVLYTDRSGSLSPSGTGT